MGKQLGREALLYFNNTGNTYSLVGGCTTTGFNINNEPIDCTTIDTTLANPTWMQSLNGVKSVELSADAVFLDDTIEAALELIARGKGGNGNFRYVFPHYGQYQGEFLITSFAFTGSLDSPVNFSITLQSSGSVSYTGFVPFKPVNFRATKGNAQVKLDWDNPDDYTITKYQIKQGSAAWADITGSNRNTVTHTVTGLTNGTAYTFRIRAVNSVGNGTQSDQVTATPTT